MYARQSETNGATGANTGDVQGLLTFNNINNVLSTGNAFADFIIGPGARRRRAASPFPTEGFATSSKTVPRSATTCITW